MRTNEIRLLSNDIYNETQVLTNKLHQSLGKATSEFGVTIPCLLEKLYKSSINANEKVIDMMTNAKA